MCFLKERKEKEKKKKKAHFRRKIIIQYGKYKNTPSKIHQDEK